ncbi:unnamed protein product, partial [Polarella glacialis]
PRKLRQHLSSPRPRWIAGALQGQAATRASPTPLTSRNLSQQLSSPRAIRASPTPLTPRTLRQQLSSPQAIRASPAPLTPRPRTLRQQLSSPPAPPRAKDFASPTPSEAVEIEICSSDEDGETSASPRLIVDGRTVTVRLLVDDRDRERLRNTDPRGFFERISAVLLPGPHRTVAVRQRLRFGDFTWVKNDTSCGSERNNNNNNDNNDHNNKSNSNNNDNNDNHNNNSNTSCGSEPSEDWQMLSCIVERKRIPDLVGRSAAGDHIRQLQRLETCGLQHAFLLLEGDTKHAASCAVYDEGRDEAEVDGEPAESDVIRSGEDIDELCARLLVTNSSVGVLGTRDAEGTARLLGQLSAWFAWEESEGRGASSAQSLRSFEESAVARADARSELAQILMAAGIAPRAVEAVRRRFGSLQHAQATLMACGSPHLRCAYFEFNPHCKGLGERLCAVLGAGVPASAEMPATAERVAHVAASHALFRRLGRPTSPAVQLEEVADLWADKDGSCCGKIVIRAGTACSAAITVIVVPACWLVSEVQRAALRTAQGASCGAAIADAAAAALHQRLEGLSQPPRDDAAGPPQQQQQHQHQHHQQQQQLQNPESAEGLRSPPLATTTPTTTRTRPPTGTRLLVLEGLRAAVRQAQGGTSSEASPGRPGVPELLGICELTSVLMDLRCGWRCRVHDARAAETSASFLRVLVRVALEEAALTLESAARN